MIITKQFPFIKFNKGFGSKIRDGYIWYEFYYGQGLTIYDKIKQPAMVLTALGAITYFKLLPQWILYLFVPVWFIGWLCVGLVIFEVFKIPQRSSVIGGSKISDWEKKKMKLLKKIERNVK